MKDCENCRKQPSCQRYGHIANRSVNVNPSVGIAADCRHFENYNQRDEVSYVDFVVQKDPGAPVGTSAPDTGWEEWLKSHPPVKVRYIKETDHRERGCSNCKWFNGFASYAIWGETIRHLWEIVNCKHSEDDGVRTVCPDGGCEHHEFRDDGAIL